MTSASNNTSGGSTSVDAAGQARYWCCKCAKPEDDVVEFGEGEDCPRCQHSWCLACFFAWAWVDASDDEFEEGEIAESEEDEDEEDVEMDERELELEGVW